MCVWLPIENYEGLYEVSSEGEIRNVRTGRILKQRKNAKGYLVVTLGERTARRGKLVHRLVALAHVPNPYNLPEVNHIDEDKANPKASNLEWMTHQENSEYTLAKSYKVRDPNNVIVEIFNLNKFCRSKGYHVVGFWRMVTGERPQYKGWRLANE